MRQTIFRQLAAVLLVCGATACDSDPTDTNYTAVVTTTVARASVRAADTVTVHVTTTNKGPGVMFVSGVGSCVKFFEVLYGDHVIMPNGAYCAAVNEAPAVPVKVLPNRSLTVDYIWRAELPWLPALLTPGTYQIRGLVYSNGQSTYGDPIDIQIVH